MKEYILSSFTLLMMMGLVYIVEILMFSLYDIMKHPIDINRPICVNIGCESPVHLANRSSTGRPVYRPVCGACHKAKLNLREGVTAVKKDYCENKDSRLGFECTATIIGTYQLDMDHIDGDHYHNVPENIQTICKNCHAVKSRENKDQLNFMKNL